MHRKIKRAIANLAVAAGVSVLTPGVHADSEDLSALSARWWQWALSVPASNNPMTDTAGANCMVGQSGSTWFLAGRFDGTFVERNCTIPDNVNLFFPVANSVAVNSPGICGEPARDKSVAELRKQAADFIDGISAVTVMVDGRAIRATRVRSAVFVTALPEVNVFDALCGAEGVPAGIYSPSVDDGYYARVKSLKAGSHTLSFQAQNASGIVQDITYHLTVNPGVVK